MKKVAIIIARMGSTRLPGKVMLLLNGKPVLQHIIERCRASKYTDQVVVATIDQGKSFPIFHLCNDLNCEYYAGIEENNVLKRIYNAAKKFDADIITEITADCPFVSHYYIDKLLEMLVGKIYDYASNVEFRSFADGLDVQAYYFEVLETLYKSTDSRINKNHVGMNIHQIEHTFKTINYLAPFDYFYPNWRLTLDTKEDFELISLLYKKFPSMDTPAEEIINYLKSHQELLKINSNVRTKKFEEG